jgi:serine/threonine-protein phosphatase 2A regulatory subunit B''
VLYCKFWELDTDHDFKLSRADLAPLRGITPVVLDRVFAQAGRRFVALADRDPRFMGYEDFVTFFLASEDKTSVSSLRCGRGMAAPRCAAPRVIARAPHWLTLPPPNPSRARSFWFSVCDLDGDGVLTSGDLRPLYEQQAARMAELGVEVVKFDDVLCQFADLLRPAVPGRFRLADFTHPERVKLTGVLFSALCDLEKFQRFEGREPCLVKQGENYALSQWDRYAAAEYTRLANEEEAQRGASWG